jgi:hypothetical protein
MFVVLAALAAGGARAHMLTMEERDVGGIRVLMGYFADGAYAVEPLLLMLGLEDIASREPVTFAEVAVQIASDGGRPVLDEVFTPENSVAYVDYDFPKAGEYDIKVAFKRGGEKTIEATFSLIVIPNPFAGERTLFDRMIGAP